ncbi:phenoloxidase-activating factor 3 [Lepeophtheirus salmonis]|uniref:phenoloxidase-activating factor 3 n=1 Tax=Lepeophtheirus salmonis TaxID=72036 RepID=UPI001AE8E747|nr:phenoloxidase-activating factor 3-like isoform X1 [Lepeophtheirus salmonis]
MWTKSFVLCTTYVSIVASFSRVLNYECGNAPLKGLRGCNPRTSNRIINGVRVERGEIPWQILIVIGLNTTYPTTFDCGGTIISDFYVLTVGHCISSFNISGIIHYPDPCKSNIYAGDIQRKAGVSYPVSKFILHPSYKKIAQGMLNDIGLVKIVGPFQFNALIQPVCLPLYGNETNKRESVIVGSGWGVNSIQQISGSYHLMRTDLKVQNMSNNVCKEDIFQCADPASYLCTFNPPSSGCYGDSGSPATLEVNGRCILVGVFSSGARCGETSFLTNVSYYLNWIDQHIQETSLTTC